MLVVVAALVLDRAEPGSVPETSDCLAAEAERLVVGAEPGCEVLVLPATPPPVASVVDVGDPGWVVVDVGDPGWVVVDVGDPGWVVVDVDGPDGSPVVLVTPDTPPPGMVVGPGSVVVVEGGALPA